MKMHYLMRILILILISFVELFAQKVSLSGKIFDAGNKTGLPFANIRIERTNKGTAANKEGNYRLNLYKGNYKIIASYIGYKPDTVFVNLTGNKELNFALKSATIEISGITVSAKNDFVSQIIMNTIRRKEKNKQKLKTYKYSAYTKGIVKTSRNLSSTQNNKQKDDNSKLKINGIIENESRGFFKKPDFKKFYIVARKQTKNIPMFINAMTGSSEIQSLYNDEVEFMGRYMPSPISKRALKFYNFNLKKEIKTKNKKIYIIAFTTQNPSTVGLYGNLFIEDGSFILLKAETFLNSAANPGGLFDYIKIFQQFTTFQDSIILPIDYHLSAVGNYLGLVKFGFELHTVMYDYEINKKINNNIFNHAILTVLPDADKKDKAYWNSIKAIPTTIEEKEAYKNIELKIKNSKRSTLSLFLSPQFKLNENFSITGPLSIYNFNKVEGSNLSLGLFYNNALTKRTSGKLNFSYGFSDKKIKKEFELKYLLGNYRTTKIHFKFFDKITALFKGSDNYNKFTSTWLSLLTKYDFRDYYYTKGFTFKISGDVFPVLNIGIGFINRTDKKAFNNSDFSFFYKTKKYSSNLPVFDTKTNALSATFKLDFRKFIEDGFFRKRISPPNVILFEGSALISNKDIFKSQNNFQIYRLQTYGRIPTFRTASLSFDITNIFSNGSVPYQMMYALSGNINVAGKNNSFRTLRIGEIFGDNVTTIFLTHNFNDELFKLLGIPFLKRSYIQLKTYLNIALSDISGKSKQILPVNYRTFKSPFYELGFSIGHVLFPVTLEFTWKLNYRGHNNFVFGLNTFVL